jgi:hypothetical protein
MYVDTSYSLTGLQWANDDPPAEFDIGPPRAEELDWMNWVKSLHSASCSEENGPVRGPFVPLAVLG